MPLDSNVVIEYIKKVEASKIDPWRAEYFKKITKQLQVHTKGHLFTKVNTLFPHEHPESKKHCVTTYEPITKSSIWKGINNINRIFANSSFTIHVGNTLRTWLNEYDYNGTNLLNYFLDTWVAKAIAEDPNGLFVIYPPDYALQRNMCPIQFVRSDLIKSTNDNYVAFISEVESEIEYSYEESITKREIFYDETIDALNGVSTMETTYNNVLKLKVVKPVVHVLTRSFLLTYQGIGEKTFKYTTHEFLNDLSCLPYFIAGGLEIDKAGQSIYDSFVSPFIPFGNLALLQHRNHRAVDLQFSYPRMSELQVPCDEPGCVGGRIRCSPSDKFPNGWMPCTNKQCRNGYVTIQSPYKVYARKYDPNDQGNNEHLKVPPVEFYSPDSAIINYSKDSWKEYLKMAESAIYIMQKVYTGQVQSAESKEVDQEEFYAWLNNISKVFYKNLNIVLQVLEEYLDSSPSICSVERPYSFAIMTETEAFEALNKILESKAPVFIKANQVENFIHKFVSHGSPIVKILEILKRYDPLLYYSVDSLQSFKASNIISSDMWSRHVMAYPTLLRMYEQDKLLLDQDVDKVIDLLDAEIAKLIPKPTDADFRRELTDII